MEEGYIIFSTYLMKYQYIQPENSDDRISSLGYETINMILVMTKNKASEMQENWEKTPHNYNRFYFTKIGYFTLHRVWNSLL